MRRRLGSMLLLVLLADGCADYSTTAPDIASVTVTPSSVTLVGIGAEAMLAATVRSSEGQSSLWGIEWTNSNPSVVELVAMRAPNSTSYFTPRAHVRAVGPGSATITAAAYGGVTADAFIEVVEVSEYRMSRASDTLRALGDTVRLYAEGLTGDGNWIPALDFTWRYPHDPEIAVVDSTGLVTAIGNGTTTFSASRHDDHTDTTIRLTASITVAQVATEITRGLPQSIVTLDALGDTMRFSVEGRDSNGHPVANDLFEWRSDDENVAVVDGTGLVVAAGNGSATISVTSGAVAASVRVTVAQEITGIRVTPQKDTLRAPGDTLRLAGVLVDPNGHPVEGADTVFTWWSSDESVAIVDGNGLVTAVAEGTAEITAQSAGTGLSAAADVLAWFPSDRDILVTLYNATNGRFWRNSEGWLTDVPLDSWRGVETDAGGRVISLNLWRNGGKNGLSGPIPPELGYLSELRELNLGNNGLTGLIPPELGRLAKLESLTLSANRLTEVPAQLGELGNLVTLNIRGNTLESIPPELAKLAKLRYLQLSDNRLTGDVLRLLADLSQLRTLDLYDNRLSGTIPAELGALANLEVLDLGRNHLTGDIPAELGELTNLYKLNLSSWACCNQLTGSIPPELGNLAKLSTLGLRNLGLTGSIPPELGNLTRLHTLEIDFNNLTGAIPASLGNLHELSSLYLTSNELTGSIPPEFGNLSRLALLWAGRNRLEGQVPSELGDLPNLESLTLHGNELTGLLPPQLGSLRRLELLFVNENDLSGPIPLEFVNLPLSRFEWDDSKLCAPLDPAFQAWLETIRDMKGGPGCLTDALMALYEATGGPAWTNAANWLTDEPVSEWHGVMADEEGRIMGLDLRGNGLRDTVPSEIGALADLRRLDLRDNRLAGELPGKLADLAELRELYLSGNQLAGRLPAEFGNLAELTTLDVAHNQFTGAVPSSFAGLSKLTDFHWSESGLCAPAVDWYQSWLGAIANHTGGTNCSPALKLSVPAAHVNQAAQDLAGSVPLIAGREGLLRVFATADQANEHRPGAQATFFLNGREVHRAELVLASERGIAEDPASGQPDQYFRAKIPGEVLVPGIEMAVDVDPDSVVPRAPGSVVRFPAQGRIVLEVREMPRMDLTVVPVLAAVNPDSSVLEWVAGMGPGHAVIEYVTHVLPVGEYSVNVREPFIRSSAPLQDLSDWSFFASEIRLLRATENGTGYYYGVIGPRPGSIGGVGGSDPPVGVGKADAEFMAHEIGHGMKLWHAPCGLFGTQEDPRFPYLDGSIGVWGYDARGDSLVLPSTPDLMSYCRPRWISDYYFHQAMRYRLETERAPPPRVTVDAAAARSKRLLVWGGASPEGELRLNPAFALDMRAELPARPGPYRLEGFGAEGAREFSLDFEMDGLSHGGGNFLFAIPFEERWLGTLERIVLTGPEGTVELNGASEQAMALVLDRETGSLRSVLRGEDAVGALTAATAETSGPGGNSGSDTRVVVSYGLPGSVPN